MTGAIVEDFLTHWAERKPARLALVADGEAFSWSEFRNAISLFADHAEAAGVVPGSTAVVATRSLLESWIAVHALRALGVATIARDTVESAAAHFPGTAACLVAGAADLAAARAPARLPALVVPIPPGIAARARSGEAGRPRPLAARASHFLLSSGTTGVPKLVEMRPADEPSAFARRAEFYGYGEGTVFHNGAFGLWTAGGLRYSQTVWHAGGAVVTDRREDAFRRFTEHGVNDGFMVPGQFPALLDARGPGAAAMDHVRLIIAGGFMPLPLAMRVRDRLTPRLRNVYTASELNTVMLYRDLGEPLEDFHWLRARGDHVVEIVDEDGRPCPVGTEGQLRYLLREGDCREYPGDPEATARVFRNGWFHPGDMAVRRADGAIRVTGRADEVIVLGGEKRAAAPLELELREAIGAGEVCVFTGPDPSGAEVMVVAVESPGPLSRDRLAPARERLARFGRVVFAVVPAFPRTVNGMGKVRRAELRRRVFGGLSRPRGGGPGA